MVQVIDQWIYIAKWMFRLKSFVSCTTTAKHMETCAQEYMYCTLYVLYTVFTHACVCEALVLQAEFQCRLTKVTQYQSKFIQLVFLDSNGLLDSSFSVSCLRSCHVSLFLAENMSFLSVKPIIHITLFHHLLEF